MCFLTHAVGKAVIDWSLSFFPTFTVQHPCVHDEVSSISLVGLPALKALLYHCQYFQHVARSASICYQGRYTFPIIPAVPLENKSLGKNQFQSKSKN